MPTDASVIQNAIELSDLAIVLATLLSPFLAVHAQKVLEEFRATKEQRRQIFKVLMATRAAPLSPSHVEALNAVPVEFFGNSRELKEITDKWKEYLDHHSASTSNEIWLQKRQDLFVDLLFLISKNIGYNFSRSQIDRDIYYPQAHGVIEDEQTIIRKGFAQLFKGEIAFPMAVTEFPATADENTLSGQAELQKLLLEWLKGERSVKMTPQEEERGNCG